jgi:hypothetical protein
MLRITDEGRVPLEGPIAGVATHPLAFTWDPVTGALWALFPAGGDSTEIRSLAGNAFTQTAETTSVRGIRRAAGASAGLLFPEEGAQRLAARVHQLPAVQWTARLTSSIQAESAGATLDRVGDVVAGSNGTLFLLMENVIVRLTPTMASAAR